MDYLAQHIEALIFCAPKPISETEILGCLKEMFEAEVPIEDVKSGILKVKERYTSEEHSFENIAEVLVAISVVLMSQGNNNEAIRISKLVEPLSCGLNKERILSEMYSQFSEILFDRGKKDEALHFFGMIKTRDGRVFQTGSHMIKKLIGFNKIQESIELADLLQKIALEMNMRLDFLSYAQSKIAVQLMNPGNRSKFL